MAALETQLKNKKAAESFYLKKLELMKSIHDSINIGKSYYLIGRFYRKINKPQKAIINLNLAKKIFKTTGFPNNDYRQKFYTNNAMAYNGINDFENAYKYLRKSYVLKDSIERNRSRSIAIEMEAKYQNKEKQQKIELLKTQNILEKQQKKSQRNLLLGGLGITTLTGLFLLVMYRNRKKTNEKLKELDKTKSNFFANISHEFRTPLTLISNPIEETLDDKTISETKRHKFTVAKQNTERLLSLVNQLLDLSKIDAGQLQLQLQKSPILKHILALSDSFSYLAKQKKINYSVLVKDDNANVWFDRDALEKIVTNLLSNAIKYTAENGEVYCYADIKNENLILQIKNSGIALTEDEMQNIFKRFHQTNETNQGTGIGLALVKELVELHYGNIKVKNDPSGFITFKVTLPINKNSFKAEQFITTTKEPIYTKTQSNVSDFDEQVETFSDNDQPILLIVEDHNDVRDLLKQIFASDYNVITAANGEKGITLALEHIPDIIISDVMMPVKDGIALTNELKNDERTCHIPIILLTAKAGEANELKGIEIGADDYITKPFSSKILTTKVSKLIEIRQKLQKRYSQEIILTPKNIAVTNLDEKFLEKVQTVLKEKLVESSFSIEDFSRAVGMSRMQLHRKLKALTGLSASEFIRSQRLKLATELLKKSDANVSEIGYSVGFNDHSYFAKCFKEAYGCSPSEYLTKK